LVKEFSFVEPTLRMPVSDLENGLYIIKLANNITYDILKFSINKSLLSEIKFKELQGILP